MRRVIVKEVFFLTFMAFAIVCIVGVVLHTNSQAQDSSFGWVQDWDWDDDWDDDWDYGKRSSFDVRYNRVEGLYSGVRLRQEYWRRKNPSYPFLYGFGGYSFAAKELQGQIGLEKGFFKRYRFAVGGEVHYMIDTPDRWIVPDWENSLAAFFLKEDFHDYFFREGWSGYILQNFTREVSVYAGYHYDKLDSLERNTDWALFGSKKHFRENPAMFDGKKEMHSLVGRLVVDTRNSKKRPSRGWLVQVEGEHTGDGLRGDFDFDRLLVDVRRYQPLGFEQNLDFRLRVGTAHGDLPWHKSYHLGGLSTLRGFPYKVFPGGPMSPGGNRTVLAQVEYRMGPQEIPEELYLWILEHFNLILFVDVGWVGSVDTEASLLDGFDGLSWSSLKSDVGIALANRSGSVRFQVARRTDTGRKPYVFTFRISRPF